MSPLGLRCSWMAAALIALAAGPAQAEPAVLYVPTEDVVLTPTNTPGCTSQVNSATGCAAGIDMMQVVPPYASAMALRDALEQALSPYDVHLATERPPEYLAYTMLVANDTPDPTSTSVTCSRAAISCGARKRNGIVHVFGPTANCSVLDVPLASIYAFGRISGLEGVADPLDAMRYIPNFATQSGTFVDGCSPRVQQISFDEMGVGTALPLECTSLDHNGCGPDDQNGHADLLAYYGPRMVDVDPPELTNLEPGDGAMIAPGDELVMDVDISDADPVLGGRWTVSSPALEDLGFDGVLTFCTNDVCDAGWDDAQPLKATASDWRVVLLGIPEGTYELTFEASDFHGNVSASPTMVVVIGDPPPGAETGGGSTSSVDTSGGPGATTATSDSPPPPPPLDSSTGMSPASGDDSGTGDPEADDGMLVPHGCACTARSTGDHGAGAWWLLVVVALARRRT